MGKVDDLLACLIPRRCVLCGQPSGALTICCACLADLPWLGDEDPGMTAGMLAALSYEYPVDCMITRAKFRRELHFAWALGEILVRAVTARRATVPSLLVPVPLHPKRLAERGYNQALEIARPLAERLPLKLAPQLCERRKPTAEQTGLSAAERRRNVHQAFRVRSGCSGAHIAILDDVITTGSTTAALAQAFHEAGAARVDVWAVARTL